MALGIGCLGSSQSFIHDAFSSITHRHIATNPHAPPHLRVNGSPLRIFP